MKRVVLRKMRLRKTIGMILIVIFCMSICVALPPKLLEPYDAEIGRVTVTPSSTDDYTSVSDIRFQTTFIVTITKLIYIPQSYQIILGYQRGRLDLNLFSGAISTYIKALSSSGDTSLSSSFTFFFYHSDQTDLYQVIINYLLVGKALIIPYLFVSFYQYNDISASPCDGFSSPATCPYTIPMSLPHLNYKCYTSVIEIYYQKNPRIIHSYLIKFDLKIASFTLNSLNIQLNLQDLKVYGFGFDFIAIDKKLFDQTIPQSTLILQHTASLSTPTSITYAHTFSQTVTPTNFFMGISLFKGGQSLFEEFSFSVTTPANDNILHGSISSLCQNLDFFVFVMYGYAPKCKTKKFCAYCAIFPDFFCSQCEINFTPITLPSGDLDCQCQTPYQLVSGVCDIIPFGCIVVERLTDTAIKCHQCDPIKKLTLNTQSNSCECLPHYFMDVNQTCQDVCGDGFVEKSQCDDGNTFSGDGCSSTCALENGFNCDKNSEPTKCKSELILFYKIESITKNPDQNSAILKLKLRNPSIYTFPVQKNQFQPAPSFIKFKVIISRNPHLEVSVHKFQLLSINEEKQIQIQFFFDTTIELTEGFLELKYEQTNYKNYTQVLEFQIKGDNLPLKFENNIQTYKTMGTGMLVGAILNVLLFLIGLVSPKFIGVEAVLTLQLIFFSQILVQDNEKFPVGFLFLQNLQYSTGFNRIFQSADYIPSTENSIKMNHIKREKLLIENFNLNFALLIIPFILLAFSMFLRARNQKQIQLSKGTSNKKIKKQLLKQNPLFRKISDYAFCTSNQIAFWLFLPLLSSVTSSIVIENYTVTTSLQGAKLMTEIIVGNIIACLGFFIIFGIILNNFSNLWLSQKTLKQQHDRPQETSYKKILFIYLFAVGSLIFFVDKLNFHHIYCSSIVLLLHTIYIIVIFVLNPYKYSLKIHTIGMLLSNLNYLVFLIVVNAINYIESINPDITLLLAYTTVGLSGFSIILSVIRLYYELRYGKELEEKMEEERAKKQYEEELKKAEKFKRERDLMENQSKKKTSEKQRIRKLNFYLYENQVKQDNQKQLIEWLQSRSMLDQKIKEKRYFEKFAEKPLKWLQKNDAQKFDDKMKEINDHFKVDKTRQLRKNEDERYNKIASKLRKEVKSNKKDNLSSLIKHEKRMKMRPDYAMNMMKNGSEKFMNKAYELKD